MMLTSKHSPASTCTIILYDDGLLKTSTGCIDPTCSLTLYVGCSKFTIETVEIIILSSVATMYAA